MLHALTNDRKTQAEASTKTAESLPAQERFLQLPGWTARSHQAHSQQHQRNLAALQKSYGNQAVLRMQQVEKGRSQGDTLQPEYAYGNNSVKECVECSHKKRPLDTIQEYSLTRSQTLSDLQEPTSEDSSQSDIDFQSDLNAIPQGTKNVSPGRCISSPYYGLVSLQVIPQFQPKTTIEGGGMAPGGGAPLPEMPSLSFGVDFEAKANLPYPSRISLQRSPEGRFFFVQNIRKLSRKVNPCGLGSKGMEVQSTTLDTQNPYNHPAGTDGSTGVVKVPGQGSCAVELSMKDCDIPSQTPCSSCDFTQAPTFIFAHDEFRLFAMYEPDFLTQPYVLGYIDWMWEALASFQKTSTIWIHGIISSMTNTNSSFVQGGAQPELEKVTTSRDLCNQKPVAQFHP